MWSLSWLSESRAQGICPNTKNIGPPRLVQNLVHIIYVLLNLSNNPWSNLKAQGINNRRLCSLHHLPRHFLQTEPKQRLTTIDKLHITLNQPFQLAAELDTSLFVLSGIERRINKKNDANSVCACMGKGGGGWVWLRIQINKMEDGVTHSSITSPSPTILGPVSSGGFLRVSSAASASASWRFNLSNFLMI